MNEIIEKENIDVRNMIYEVNGVEVMLDSDLAKLYDVETKRINEAVKNNPSKFPKRFSWQLSEEEIKLISKSQIAVMYYAHKYEDSENKENLRSKISTSSLENTYGGRRYLPRVFTEQGIYMLATVLKSKKATEVSIRIMDAFVKMRHYINYNNTLLPNRILLLEEKVDDNTKRIDKLFDTFNPNDIVKDKIFFEGEFYLAYSFLIDIFDKSKKEIIIIDNYAGKELLDILKDIDRKILIVSKNINKALKNKYEKEYHNVTFIESDAFHDRFIILDRIRLFHIGASLKDIGKKGFAISEIVTTEYLILLLNRLDLM